MTEFFATLEIASHDESLLSLLRGAITQEDVRVILSRSPSGTAVVRRVFEELVSASRPIADVLDTCTCIDDLLEVCVIAGGDIDVMPSSESARRSAFCTGIAMYLMRRSGDVIIRLGRLLKSVHLLGVREVLAAIAFVIWIERARSTRGGGHFFALTLAFLSESVAAKCSEEVTKRLTAREGAAGRAHNQTMIELCRHIQDSANATVGDASRFLGR